MRRVSLRPEHRSSVYAYKIDYVNYYRWITVEKLKVEGLLPTKAL